MKKNYKLKTKENNEIEKLKEENVKRSSIIETPSTLPKIIQDDKARTFAPPDNTTGPSPLERINKSLSTLKSMMIKHIHLMN